MPLCGGLVVAPALWKCKAVVNLGIELDLAGGAGISEQPTERLDHRQRRQIVMLRTGDVELAFDPSEREVWARFGVADEPGPVIRRRGGNPLGVPCRCREGVRAAHAISMATDRPPL